MEIMVARTQKQIADHFYVRGMVFVVEQKIDYEIEFDGLDSECVLFVVYDDHKPVAAARLYGNKIGRVATLKDYRKQGIATALMHFIEDHAVHHQMHELKLHAQLYVKDFYCHLGYQPVGAIFQEADIDHVKMVKSLSGDV